MPIQSAKEDFSKEEVIEILRRNVALYKDEREFIEYIVELATYLIDRHYGKGELSEGGMPKPPGERGTPAAPHPPQAHAPEAPLPPRVPTPIPEADAGSSGPGLRSADLPPRVSDLRGRHTDSGRFIPPSPIEKASPSPPPPPPGTPPPPPKADDEAAMPSEPPSGKYQNLTPPPPDVAPGEPPPPKTMVNVSSLGKARVYKVVRPYRVSTAAQVPCPVCGAQVPIGERQCPSCGHVL